MSRPHIAAIAAAGLLTAAALISVCHATVDLGGTVSLPANDPYAKRVEESTELFSATDFSVVALKSSSAYEPELLRRVAVVAASLHRLDTVASVVSAVNVPAFETGGQDGASQTLIDVDRHLTSQAIRDRFDASSDLHELFVAGNGRAQLIFVIPANAVDKRSYVDQVGGIVDDRGGEGAFFGGWTRVGLLLAQAATAGLFRTLVPATVFVLCAAIFLLKGPSRAVILALLSLLPALWTLGLYAPFGVSIGLETVGAPVVVLALSTSFSLHVIRHFQTTRLVVLREKTRQIAPVVLAASGTTLAGFAGLLISDTPAFRTLSLLVMAGVVFSVFAALVLAPPIIETVATGGSAKTLTYRQKPGIVGASRNVGVLSAAGIVATLLLLSGAGMTRLGSDYRLLRLIRFTPEVEAVLADFRELGIGLYSVQVTVDTGVEFGLVEPEVFEAIHDFGETISGLPSVAEALDPSQLVVGVHRRLAGDTTSFPRTDAEIGEAMELLSSGRGEFPLHQFLSADWSALRIWFPLVDQTGEPQSQQQVDALLGHIISEAEGIPGSPDVYVTGWPVESGHVYDRTLSDLLTSGLTFLAFLLVLLPLVLGSVRLAFAALLPTTAAAAVFFGFSGLLGAPVDPVTFFYFAMVLGVSSDDVLYLLIVYRRERKTRSDARALSHALTSSGTAILQTTILLIAALAGFQFSTDSRSALAALSVIAAFVVSTAVTIGLVPRIIHVLRLQPSRIKGSIRNPRGRVGAADD